MTGSPGTVTAPEWYLARDGEQFGPLSDVELRKLVEFGHLKPTDLLWREGFPEWRSARILLNETAQAAQEAPAAVQADHAGTPANTLAQSAAPLQRAHPVQATQAIQSTQPAAVSPAPQMAPAPSPQPAAHPNATKPDDYGHGRSQGHPHPQDPQAYPNRAMVAAQPSVSPPNAALYGDPTISQRQPTAPHSQHPATLPAQARPVDLGRPAAAAPVARKQKRPNAAPVARPYDDEDDDDGSDSSAVVRSIKRIAVLLFFTATLAAAAWYIYPQRDRIFSTLKLSSLMGVISVGSHPLTGYKATADDTDKSLQSNELWRVLKREFPEWYGERVKEASSLAASGKSDAEIGRQMMTAIVTLRRKHAGDALSATVPRLKTLAVAFADNLTLLRRESIEACHAFVSSGETAPDYLRLLATSSHSRTLQAQLVAVFEAIADGRKIPRIYPQPKQADYNLLVSALEARGWTDADMNLFSDSRRFGAAPPEQVCKMVTDWFKAQVELADADAQLRLLADALKPVVAG